MSTSLTPVNAEVTLNDVLLSDNDVDVCNIRITNGVNMVAEANIGISFRSKKGLSYIQNIFPSSSTDTKILQTVMITLKGYNQPLSRIKKDMVLFLGYTVGFGIQISNNSYNYVINAFGPFSIYQNVPIFMPGFHSSSPTVQNVIPSEFNKVIKDGTSPTLNKMVIEAATLNNGFDIFKKILEVHDEACKGTLLSNIDAFNAFKTSFGIGTNNSKLFKEYQHLIQLGDLNISFTDMGRAGAIKEMMLESIKNYIHNDPKTLFWSILGEVMEMFGICFSSSFGSILGIPKLPLSKPISTNEITSQEIVNANLADFPFSYPTRGFLTANTPNSFNTNSMINFGEYPRSSSPIGQEIESGVFMKVYESPRFLQYVSNHDKTITANSFYNKSNMEDYKETLDTIIKTILSTYKSLSTVYDDYAKYMLMCDKSVYRKGSFDCIFKPELVPGFCGHIYDPMNILKIVGYYQQISHYVDCSSGTAITQVGITNLRLYESDEDMNNPFYPNYDTSTIDSMINNVFLTA